MYRPPRLFHRLLPWRAAAADAGSRPHADGGDADSFAVKLVRARQEDGDYIDPKLEAFVQRHIKLCNGMSTNAIKVLRKRVTKLVVEGMIGMAHAARAMRHGPCRMGNLSYSQVAA